MSDGSAVQVVRRALTEMRGSGQLPPVLEFPGFDPAAVDPAGRFELPPGPSEWPEIGLASEAWYLTNVDDALGVAWPHLFRGASLGGPGPRILARYDPARHRPPVADLAAFGSIPRCRVAVPADAPTTRELLRAMLDELTPAYARIPAGEAPATGAGTFGWASAPTLEDGSDLTVIGVGPILSEVRALRGRLRSIGISARVLDGASVKPIDAATIVRAARETGALLVAEEHHALSGFGASVAALTALAYPVPVRRVGYPDLPAREGATGAERDRYGLSPARLDEEAWELLKARGKVQ